MPFNKMDTVLSNPQLDSISAALDELLDPANMPEQFNLTKKERTDLPNIADERYPYVKRAIENHAPANPKIVAGVFAGSLPEAVNDLTYYDQVQPFIGRLKQIIEIFEDTQQVAGSEAFTWLRGFYASAQLGAKNQLPGADAVVDDLKPLFDKETSDPIDPGVEPNPVEPVEPQ